MDFQLTEEQVLLQKMASDFAAHHLLPHAPIWDRDNIFPKDALREAAKLGMASMVVPEHLGGSGLTRLDTALVLEQLATACVSTTTFLSIHNMVANILARYGSAWLTEKWSHRLATMDVFGSYCLTEPSSGSDAASLKTRARKEGHEYVINGSKAFISGGGTSDIYLCMVRTGDETHHGISCILIEKDRPGLTFGKQEAKLGWHSQPNAMLFFEDCRVPIENLLGHEGMGFKIALQALNSGRVNIAACSLGGALACIRLAKTYMMERHQFGKTLNQFQALRFQLSDMFTRLHAARLLVYRAADAIDHDLPNARMYAAMAKKIATEFAFDISDKALQLHGGYGCLKEYAVERFFRDLRLQRVVEGTSEIMLEIISKSMFEEDFVID